MKSLQCPDHCNPPNVAAFVIVITIDVVSTISGLSFKGPHAFCATPTSELRLNPNSTDLWGNA